MEVVSQEFIVGTKSGLHARPATQIARAVTGLNAAVTLWKGDQRADAKSVFSILILEAGPGCTVRVDCRGPEKDRALAALKHLFETNFHESSS